VEEAAMSEVGAFVWMSVGVLVSVILPVLSGLVRKKFPKVAAPGPPPWLTKYALLFAFSLITGLVILAIYRSQNPTSMLLWYQAFLAGYTWEATIEKIAA
jgi:hypothetical protein